MAERADGGEHRAPHPPVAGDARDDPEPASGALAGLAFLSLAHRERADDAQPGDAGKNLRGAGRGPEPLLPAGIEQRNADGGSLHPGAAAVSAPARLGAVAIHPAAIAGHQRPRHRGDGGRLTGPPPARIGGARRTRALGPRADPAKRERAAAVGALNVERQSGIARRLVRRRPLEAFSLLVVEEFPQQRTESTRRARPQAKRTFTSGRFSRCTVSMKRTWRLSRVMTSDCVRVPSPKKRTPFSRFPSVTPVQAKMIFLPGARSSVS